MDYFKLPLLKRDIILSKEAAFIATENYYGHKIRLYFYQGRYIEAWNCAITGKLKDIIPLSKTRLFRKYITHADVASKQSGTLFITD